MAPHICSLCNREFSQKSHLDDHLLKKIPCAPTVQTNIVEFEDSSDIEMERTHQRDKICLEIKQKKEKKARKGEMLVYSNQEDAANAIIKQFLDGKVIVCLVAQPGTGKTGTAHQVMMQLSTHIDPSIFVFANEMVVLSGMNDKEWKDQFERSICEPLAKNVIHRGILPRAKELLKKAKLLIDDECHAAADQNMVVSRMLSEANLLDIEELKRRGVRKLLISATPEAVLNDLSKWGDLAGMVILEPSEKYKGFQHMLDDERILKSPAIDSVAKCEELLTTWTLRFDGKTPKYFPCRVSSTANRKNLATAARNLGWAEPLEHDSESRIEDIDTQMENPPSKHTIIFIKGFWRASKRLVHTHVGGSYEQIPKGRRNTTATSQGLTARFCNTYDYTGDQIDPKYRPLHYCDVDAVKEYLNWIKKDGNYKKANYTSAKIRAKNGRVKAKPTKVHESNVKWSDERKIVEEETESHPIESKPIVVIQLSNENVETIKASIGKPKAIMKILKTIDSTVSKTYKSYLPKCWQMDTTDKEEKWGLERMMKKDAYSSETNIEDKTSDVLMMYLWKDKLIINAWNGTAKASEETSAAEGVIEHV